MFDDYFFFFEIYITLWNLSGRRYHHGGGQASFELSGKHAAFSDLELIHTAETLIVSILNMLRSDNIRAISRATFLIFRRHHTILNIQTLGSGTK